MRRPCPSRGAAAPCLLPEKYLSPVRRTAPILVGILAREGRLRRRLEMERGAVPPRAGFAYPVLGAIPAGPSALRPAAERLEPSANAGRRARRETEQKITAAGARVECPQFSRSNRTAIAGRPPPPRQTRGRSLKGSHLGAEKHAGTRSRVPGAAQHVSGAPQTRDLRAEWTGSAAHRCTLRCVRGTHPPFAPAEAGAQAGLTTKRGRQLSVLPGCPLGGGHERSVWIPRPQWGRRAASRFPTAPCARPP